MNRSHEVNVALAYVGSRDTDDEIYQDYVDTIFRYIHHLEETVDNINECLKKVIKST